MSLLVEADSEEPAVLAVARLVGELEGNEKVESEAASLLAKGDTAGLLVKLAGSTLLTSASEKDAEAAFLVLAHAAGSLPPDRALAAVSAILPRVADTQAGVAALRLRVLFALFNAVPHARCRFTVLLRAFQFAAATEQHEALAHAVHKTDAWALDWALDAADLRALRLASYELLEKAHAGKALAALVSYLALFEGETGAVLASVRDSAARAATLFIAAPDVFQCDLLDMVAIRQLEGDAKFGKVHRLLKIFLTGQLQDYLAFQKECADVLAAHHLVHDDCVAKMRLMSLAALGTESASGHVTYAQVQATLQVPAEEVERWVVKAIGASVLEAKMDQVQQQVIVTRSLHRVFGEQQWAELRSKLRVWRDNVAAVCATVAPAAAAASAQAVVV